MISSKVIFSHSFSSVIFVADLQALSCFLGKGRCDVIAAYGSTGAIQQRFRILSYESCVCRCDVQSLAMSCNVASHLIDMSMIVPQGSLHDLAQILLRRSYGDLGETLSGSSCIDPCKQILYECQ